MGKKVENVLVMGGGSYMPEIIPYIQNKLKLPVERLSGFGRTKGPIILEDTFKEDGPLYAVAVGLALRGLSM
jgi:Tfp pilus assembly PilM family ATPase